MAQCKVGRFASSPTIIYVTYLSIAHRRSSYHSALSKREQNPVFRVIVSLKCQFIRVSTVFDESCEMCLVIKTCCLLLLYFITFLLFFIPTYIHTHCVYVCPIIQRRLEEKDYVSARRLLLPTALVRRHHRTPWPTALYEIKVVPSSPRPFHEHRPPPPPHNNNNNPRRFGRCVVVRRHHCRAWTTIVNCVGIGIVWPFFSPLWQSTRLTFTNRVCCRCACGFGLLSRLSRI